VRSRWSAKLPVFAPRPLSLVALRNQYFTPYGRISPMRKTNRIARASLALLVVALIVQRTDAGLTGFAPDAWTRGNNANTSYFGWDVFEATGQPFLGGQLVLDDVTPDVGDATTATGTRIFQGTNGAADPSPTLRGHVSGTSNYYSFFDRANDTLVGTAPASGLGGYTTVVLQLHSTAGGSLLDDLVFNIDDSVISWTLHKHLNDAGAGGLGYHWIEWSAPGADLPFQIKITSNRPHRTIDSFEIDTYWTGGATPAVNSISTVPEPVTWKFLGMGVCAAMLRRRCAKR
jgi:hypothetical protein